VLQGSVLTDLRVLFARLEEFVQRVELGGSSGLVPGAINVALRGDHGLVA
jgi:hypothetical protein